MFYIKKFFKNLASVRRKKIKSEYDLISGMLKKKKKKMEKPNFKQQITTSKLKLGNRLFFKNKRNSIEMFKYIRSVTSLHMFFIYKFAFIRSNLFHR